MLNPNMCEFKHTTFSFDFDNTISRDPVGFLHLMDYLRERGHTVVVCTARLKEVYPEDFNWIQEHGYKVYWSEHKAKETYMAEQGVPVNVWVDDCPDAVLNDYFGEPRTHRDMAA